MPTLPPMVDRLPADILERPPDPGELWVVVHARPRQEKKLARWLAAEEIPYFLPLRRKVRQWRGRRIRSEEPLLSGYVFFVADAAARRRVFSSGAVAESVPVGDQQRLLAELRTIDRMLQHEGELAEVRGLVEGREVEILAGPAAGLRGMLVRCKDGCRLVVRLELLGRAVELRVSPEELEAT